MITLLRPSLVFQMVKHLPAMWETRVWSLGWEDSLEKEMAARCVIPACRVPWAAEAGRLQSTRSQRVRHDRVTDTRTALFKAEDGLPRVFTSSFYSLHARALSCVQCCAENNGSVGPGLTPGLAPLHGAPPSASVRCALGCSRLPRLRLHMALTPCPGTEEDVMSHCLRPLDYGLHGVLQARVLEWVAVPFSRASSQPRDWTQVSPIAGGFSTSWTTTEAPPPTSPTLAKKRM